MFSDVDEEMISEHIKSKRRRATKNHDILLRNGVDFARRLDENASRDEIAEVLIDLGYVTNAEEVEQIIKEFPDGT